MVNQSKAWYTQPILYKITSNESMNDCPNNQMIQRQAHVYWTNITMIHFSIDMCGYEIHKSSFKHKIMG